jgi:DNA mismatch repair protein MutL
MKIHLLSPLTISKIATGEVIDRPLSVVKELLENAIDANATEININMQRGGRSLIYVSDNGTGIDGDDLLLAVTRHATSKIKEDDISNILHMGFRGEALASIATAGRLHLTTRTANSDQGLNIKLDDGIINPTSVTINPAPHNIGTTVEVKDLFCFMPNRLRFLKSEISEIVACTELINSLAIVHHNIKFTLTHNNKSILEILDGHDLESRISGVLGSEFIDNTVHFDTGEHYNEIHRIRLHGYISIPTNNRTIKNKILTFVNKRLIKDSFLNKLVRVAYFNTLPEGISPTVVLFLEMPHKCVDVNIHPHKSEVRFSDERIIRDIIINSIRDSIRKVKTTSTIPQKIIQKTVENTLQPAPLPFDILNDCQIQTVAYTSKIPNIKSSKKFSEGFLGTPKFQIGDKYIVAENINGLILVDQHAAHERIVLESINKDKLIVQNLIMPLTCNFGCIQNTLLMSISEDLKIIGITLSSNGGTKILVHSIPLLPGNIDINDLLQDIISDIDGYLEIFKSHQDKFLTKVACYSSIRAGRKLNIVEMEELLRLIEKTDFGSQCIHGRPTYIELSTQSLDKLFERV